jgi:hypothetical protein
MSRNRRKIREHAATYFYCDDNLLFYMYQYRRIPGAPAIPRPRTSRSYIFDLVSRLSSHSPTLPSRSSLTLCSCKLTAYWLHYATSYPITRFNQLLYTTFCHQWRPNLGLQPPPPSFGLPDDLLPPCTSRYTEFLNNIKLNWVLGYS